MEHEIVVLLMMRGFGDRLQSDLFNDTFQNLQCLGLYGFYKKYKIPPVPEEDRRILMIGHPSAVEDPHSSVRKFNL